MSPSFPATISIPVTNHLTGETCLLQRMDQVAPSAGNLARITSISNEPENYRWLFQERLQGRPYNENDAEGFFRLGHNGWKSGDHFIFLLLTPDKSIAAAIDIKSARLEGAEIGYWSSTLHRGVMTNSVKALSKLAFAAGFRSLFARVKTGNHRSAAVLLRSGFLTDRTDLNLDSHEVFHLSAEPG